MKFTELLEKKTGDGKHRTEIDAEKALELIEQHCSQAYERLDTPLWRGSDSTKRFMLLEPQNGTRSSVSNGNYNTLCMDEFFPAHGYPKRSKSLIVANNKNKFTATSFGRTLYAIFPFDNVPIGVCPVDDIWGTDIDIGDEKEDEEGHFWSTDFESFAEELKKRRISDESFAEMVQSIAVKAQKVHSMDELGVFKNRDIEDIRRVLKDAFNPRTLGFDLASTKNIHKYETRSRELWIGGSCVAIQENLWREATKFMKHKAKPKSDTDTDKLSASGWW